MSTGLYSSRREGCPVLFVPFFPFIIYNKDNENYQNSAGHYVIGRFLLTCCGSAVPEGEFP